MDAYVVVDPNDIIAPIFFFGAAALLFGGSIGFALGHRSGKQARIDKDYQILSADNNPKEIP